ncbi:MAG: hypothetical protein K2N41_10950, partial [Lachnospiraceae bacterium]|nr:hypothetical protein [Lachnospiraceae bacterium]
IQEESLQRFKKNPQADSSVRRGFALANLRISLSAYFADLEILFAFMPKKNPLADSSGNDLDVLRRRTSTP